VPSREIVLESLAPVIAARAPACDGRRCGSRRTPGASPYVSALSQDDDHEKRRGFPRTLASQRKISATKGVAVASSTWQKRFGRFADLVGKWTGQPLVFMVNVLLIVLWLASGPFLPLQPRRRGSLRRRRRRCHPERERVSGNASERALGSSETYSAGGGGSEPAVEAPPSGAGCSATVAVVDLVDQEHETSTPSKSRAEACSGCSHWPNR
jgi:hypothetical protein